MSKKSQSGRGGRFQSQALRRATRASWPTSSLVGQMPSPVYTILSGKPKQSKLPAQWMLNCCIWINCRQEQNFRNFKQVAPKSSGIFLTNRNKEGNVDLQSWRQSTISIMATKRRKWISPSKADWSRSKVITPVLEHSRYLCLLNVCITTPACCNIFLGKVSQSFSREMCRKRLPVSPFPPWLAHTHSLYHKEQLYERFSGKSFGIHVTVLIWLLLNSPPFPNLNKFSNNM